jgi:hypothetical protein
MAAQAQQFFPLSSLFQMLNLDGKDKILPVIQANEKYQEQMLQMQQQTEQMAQQMEQLQQENQNLKNTTNEMMGTIRQMAAVGGEQSPQTPEGANPNDFPLGMNPGYR